MKDHRKAIAGIDTGIDMKKKLTFRFADENDCSLILNFIRMLADYEKMSDQVVATEELLRECIFEKRKAEVVFACAAEKGSGDRSFFDVEDILKGNGNILRSALQD